MKQTLAIMLMCAALGWGALWPGLAWAAPQRCAACHGARALATLGEVAGSAPLALARLSPCPGVVRAREEVHLTESRLVRLGLVAGDMERRGLPVEPEQAAMARLRAAFRTALEQPVQSVPGITRRLAGLRGQIHQEVAAPLWELRQSREDGRLTGLILLAALGLVLAWLVGRRRELAVKGPGPLALARRGLGAREQPAAEREGTEP